MATYEAKLLPLRVFLDKDGVISGRVRLCNFRKGILYYYSPSTHLNYNKERTY